MQTWKYLNSNSDIWHFVFQSNSRKQLNVENACPKRIKSRSSTRSSNSSCISDSVFADESRSGSLRSRKLSSHNRLRPDNTDTPRSGGNKSQKLSSTQSNIIHTPRSGSPHPRKHSSHHTLMPEVIIDTDDTPRSGSPDLQKRRISFRSINLDTPRSGSPHPRRRSTNNTLMPENDTPRSASPHTRKRKSRRKDVVIAMPDDVPELVLEGADDLMQPTSHVIRLNTKISRGIEEKFRPEKFRKKPPSQPMVKRWMGMMHTEDQ